MRGRRYLLTAAVLAGCCRCPAPAAGTAATATPPLPGGSDDPAMCPAGPGGEPAVATAQAEPGVATDPVIDDGVEVEPVAVDGQGSKANSPLLKLSDAELKKLLQEKPESVGSLSIGQASGGRLVNGVQMPEDPAWIVMEPYFAWGTEETTEYLATAIKAVRKKYPDSPRIYIGHISKKTGGSLSPHKSHQSGRDVDVGYYYSDGSAGFAYASEKRLDLPRTWAFVRALITETDAELILIDGGVQRRLRAFAEEIGEDKGWLDQVFQAKSSAPRPLIRHATGHADHIHVRFYNPTAQAVAKRVYPLLVDKGTIEPPVYFVSHKARKGDTLGSIARRYNTTVAEIQKANGLANTKIFAKKVYKIPKKGSVSVKQAPVVVPARRLPPSNPPLPAAP